LTNVNGVVTADELTMLVERPESARVQSH
jgi:hypothetical protein